MDEWTTEPIDPVHPPAPYVGGKKMLARRIIARIEQVPHHTYAEAFVGMGGIFLRRRARPRVEVINDWSAEVATLFRVLQRHYQAFVDMIRWQITGRREFERLVATNPATLTDLERAARFLYLQRTAFGGKVEGRNFGVDPRSAGGFNALKLAPLLEAVHERLAGVTIERLPYGEFIPRYDRPGTLFYLDPPYLGVEDFYGPGLFARADFERLAALLAGLAGRFILSLNDSPETRAIFAGFAIDSVPVWYGLASGQQRRSELLITKGG